MKPKLIFLHIPKAAGTSFRAMVWDLSEPEERFWYGMDTNPNVTDYSEDILEGKRFIGGHKGIKFYPADTQNLYCSLLRDPVARVKSLFSYYTRPEGAVDERSFNRRNKQLQRWLELGIDPSSIVNSLNNCQPFRNEVENHQCAYLSREGRSFEGALETIEQNNFILGVSDKISLLTDQLSNMFGWPELNTVRGNVTRAGGHDGILEEDGAEELIRELCQEDQKLYNYVAGEHKGLLTHVPAEILLRHHLSLSEKSGEQKFSRAAWSKVKLETASTLNVQRQGATTLDVTLSNNSREFLDSTLGEGVFFAYRLLDEQGQTSRVNCVRTQLSDCVPGAGQHQQTIKVRIPTAQFDNTASIRVGMLVKGEHWVEQFNLAHTATVKLIKDDT
jgi:hypothetical protein